MSVSSKPEEPPRASSPEVRSRMQAVRRRDTAPELKLRRAVHRRGLRYQVDVEPIPLLRTPGKPRISRARVAVLIRQCSLARIPRPIARCHG